MVHKIIRIFVWVLAAIVILGAGLFGYLRNADLSAYQDQVETFLSDRIGHQLKIDGRFELHLGGTTRLVAEDVSLSNPEWESDPMLLSVGHLTLAFDTWSVFGAPFVIEELRIENIQGRLERSEDGTSNWATRLTADNQEGGADFDSHRIAVRDVRVDGLQFTYVDPSRPRPIDVALEFVTVSPDANDILDLDLRGVVNDLPLWADGKLGPWHNFVGGQDIFADLDATLGQLSLAIDGSIADLARLEGVTLSGVLGGPDISNVLERLGLPPFARGEFRISANVQQQEIGHQLKIDGNLGDIALFSSGNVDSLLVPNRVTNDFSIAGPDAHYVAELFGIEGVPTSAFQISGDYKRVGRLLEFDNALLRVGSNSIKFDGELDFSNSGINGELGISASGPDFSVLGPFVSVAGLPVEAFRIDGRIRRDGTTWRADDVEAVIGNNRITADGSVTTGSPDVTEIILHAEGPDISIVQDFTKLQGIPSRPYDVTARVQSHPLGTRIIEGAGDFGGNLVEVSGVVAVRPGLSGTSLSVRASGPELHNVALLAGVPYLPDGPYEVSGDARIDGDALFLSDVEVSVAELTGSASGQVGLGPALGQVALDVSLSGPDAAKLAALEMLQPFSGDAFNIAGNIQVSGERVAARSLRVSIGDLRSEINGSVVGAGREVDLDVTARSPNSVLLRKLAKLDYLPDGDAVLSGKFVKSEADLHFTQAKFQLGEFRASADGRLSLSPRSNNSNLTFAFAGPTLTEVGEVFGIGLMIDKQFQISGRFDGTPGGFAITDIVATLGDSDLHGQFDFDLTSKPHLTGNLVSTHLDVSEKMRRIETTKIDEPQDDGLETADSEFIFPDERLDTSWLQKADINLDLKIDEFVANTLIVEEVSVGIRLLDGMLELDPVRFSQGSGLVDGRFSLAPGEGGYDLKANLTVDELRIGKLLPGDRDISKLPAFGGQLQLQGSGDSLHLIMASSNGTSAFRMGPGLIGEVFASVLFRDILVQVMSTLNPRRKSSEYQKLECAIYEVSIKDGIATIDNFAIQTDRMTTVATGTLDLRTEELNVGFRAKPREGIGISLGTVVNEFLEVRGTLQSPRISLDARSSVTATGAAVATGGLSLLARGMWDRLSAEASICEEESKKR